MIPIELLDVKESESKEDEEFGSGMFTTDESSGFEEQEMGGKSYFKCRLMWTCGVCGVGFLFYCAFFNLFYDL